MTEMIRIETHVPVAPATAWGAYTTPDAVTRWNFASAEWCCPSADIDLRAGGRYVARMEARDGSMGFDFAGVYETVEADCRLVLILDDGRRVETIFQAEGDGTRVSIRFDPESQNPEDMQRAGWQAILDNFAAYVAAGKN